jgi:hypothetical protein
VGIPHSVRAAGVGPAGDGDAAVAAATSDEAAAAIIASSAGAAGHDQRPARPTSVCESICVDTIVDAPPCPAEPRWCVPPFAT